MSRTCLRAGGRPAPLRLPRAGPPGVQRPRAAHGAGDAAVRDQVPDRQLACVPVDSPLGRAYLGAMAAAANYGRANRQLLAQAARRAFSQLTGPAGILGPGRAAVVTVR